MYLQRHLKQFFSAGIRERGYFLYSSGSVSPISGNQWSFKASVRGSQLYQVDLARTEDQIDASCECPYFQDQDLCKHLWAALLSAEKQNYLMGKFGSGPPTFITEAPDEGEDVLPPARPIGQSGKTGQSGKATSKQKEPEAQWRGLLAQIKPSVQVNGREEPWKAGREICYLIDIAQTLSGGGLDLEVGWRDKRKDGTWSKPKYQRIYRSHIGELPDPRDREILLMLGGVPEPYSYSGDTISSSYRLRKSLSRMLLPKLCATGRCRLRADALEPLESQTELAWDDGPPWHFRLKIERVQERWRVRGYLEREQDRMDLSDAALLIEDGLVFARGSAATLDHGGNFPWITLLRRMGAIEVPASHGHEFVAELLKQPCVPEIDWPEELAFEQIALPPRPCLKVEKPQHGWGRQQQDLWASLSFDYGGRSIPVEHPSHGLFEPEERRYWVRDAAAEKKAVDRIAELGLKRINYYYSHDSAPRWDLSAKKLPKVVRELVQEGWHIESEGKLFRHAGGFRAELTSGIDWFELHGDVEYGSEHVKLPDLLRALEQGDGLIRLGDGSFGVVPDEFREKYGFLMRLGRKQDDHVRFSRSQAGLLDVLLAGQDEIRVDEVFTRVRDELQSFNGIVAAEQPPAFEGRLRDYQLDGLAWMHFLRRFGFGGCLADDMGVGKTPQVLALLETRRELRQQNGNGQSIGPSLAVVPRSLVYNWKREAERFTPKLRILDHTGVGRGKNTEKFNDYDLVITTYGTLRRDAPDFQGIRFDYIILDEAQAIKNASTDSAKAARVVAGNHRIAMSGTPVENHLGELWSIFEFLNPGMLGGASVFQTTGDSLRKVDEEKRTLIAKALRPFILRRTKAQVASELPPKTEQTLYCELDANQRRLYNELRDHFREALMGRIERDGLGGSRILILEALLRLRQAACHPGLIDKKRAGESSAKLEALLPQLTEVIQEGHKALVFSQFTTFLGILRKQLDAEGIAYEYLDGKTRDREARVDRFESDPNCRLFLVSLKAGGLGLNLCAAEYVFLLDPWWNPAVEAQAIDRAHRIGQTRSVFAYRLIARDTVEEKVIELQNSKRDLADAIIRADTRLVGNLKREDLELLLS